MDEKRMQEIALIAVEKGLDYEKLKYSDYLYGKESLIDDVWEYVTECTDYGMINFIEKYQLRK